MRDYLGKTVVGGVLKFASVSSVKLFDRKTKAGCPRKWHKRYVQGIREEETENMRKAKDAGIALDKEMKHYLLTGEKNLSPLALSGLHIVDLPGPGLSVDIKINTVEYFQNGQPFAPLPELPNGEQAKYPKDVQVVIRSALSAGGIPFVGELDIAQSRGYYRDNDGEHQQDPPNTIEVSDLKFKSVAKDRDGNSTLMRETDLVRDIQMAGYGEWVARVRPSTERVRLSHLYFPKRGGSPTKVTRLHVIDDARRTWEYVDNVVRSMVDVAKETDWERVPGADRATSCDAYGGCSFRETCSAYQQTSLDNLYSKIAADHLQEKTMGLIATTQPQLLNQANTHSPPPMQQQLAQEEAAMRAQVAQQQTQMPFNAVDFLNMCHRLGNYGVGFPALAGNAAQAYAVAGGQSVAPGFSFHGIPAPAGAPQSVHNLMLHEVANVYQLEKECAARFGQPAAPQQFLTPPQAPPPQTAANTPPYNGVPNFLPPGAPESMPQLASPQAAPPVTAEAPAAAGPKRGRPKKSQDVAPEQIAVTQGAPPSPSASQVTPAASSAFVPPPPAPPCAETEAGWGSVLVNARFASKATKSLASYVDYINAELSKRYSVLADGSPGIQDVRCVPKDSPLAFGGWKGAVREIVKADPPPQGDYHLDTFMDELNEVVADALRVVSEQCGWIYVRGTR